MAQDKMIGRRFGRLTVLKIADRRNGPFYLCRCACGTEKIICGANIRAGRTKSCGCLRKNIALTEMKLQRWARGLDESF